MQIGEEQLALAEPLALDRLRLLHLHDQLRRGEELFGGVDEARARGAVILVGESCAGAGPGLDEHLVPVTCGLTRGMGREAHAEFLRLDLLRATDPHRFPPCAIFSQDALGAGAVL